MELQIFKFIDEIIEYYEDHKSIFVETAYKLERFFLYEVSPKSKYTLNVGYRIKTSESIREKLIRNNYYRKYSSKEDLLANIQDIIGIRIECKFIDDEAYVFSLLKSMCKMTDDHVYYYNEKEPKIRFKLKDKQPQKQKNGFDIYKIDGIYLHENAKVNFELQIKSLVNMFWGEIEHKVIYKNNNYMLMDEFVGELMTSIKKNLNMIDSQLHILYNRYKREDNSQLKNRKQSVEATLSKIIYDSFANKMKEQMGFTVNFKHSCDSIVKYIFKVNNATDLDDYGRILLNMFYLINNISKHNIQFNTEIEFERELIYADKFLNNVAGACGELINVDFHWHLFFLILFTIERGNNADDFESYIRYYKSRLMEGSNFKKIDDVFLEKAYDIKIDLINEFSEIFKNKAKVEFLWESGIQSVCAALKSITRSIIADNSKIPVNWDKDKKKYFKQLRLALED